MAAARVAGLRLRTMAGEVLGRGKERCGQHHVRPGRRPRKNIVEAARPGICRCWAAIQPSCPQSGAVLGLAGTNVPAATSSNCSKSCPSARALVESDALIALNGALGDHDGAIAIIGTGSIFMSRKGERLQGHRRLGFHAGRSCQQARASAATCSRKRCSPMTTSIPGSALALAVMERFEGDPRSHRQVRRRLRRPSDFGSLRADGLRLRRHRAIRSVAAWSARAARNDIEEALAALKLAGDDRLCLLGGLAGLYAPHLSENYSRYAATALAGCAGRRSGPTMAVRLFGGARRAAAWMIRPTRSSPG